MFYLSAQEQYVVFLIFCAFRGAFWGFVICYGVGKIINWLQDKRDEHDKSKQWKPRD
jgi:membrane protein DedA with SNARE-associated domain